MDARLLGYALEAVRLSGLGATREATVSDTIQEDDGRRVSVHAGDRVLVTLVRPLSWSFLLCRSAQLTPPRQTCVATGDAQVDPSRPLESYLYPGAGSCPLLGREVFHMALTEMFRAVFRKKNMRRTPGPQGELKRIFTGDDGVGSYLSEDWSSLSPLPTSMRVCWDE